MEAEVARVFKLRGIKNLTKISIGSSKPGLWRFVGLKSAIVPIRFRKKTFGVMRSSCHDKNDFRARSTL